MTRLSRNLAPTLASLVGWIFSIIDPTTSLIDGTKQIPALGFIRHSGQVLDVDVDEAGFIVLEALFRFGLDGFSFLGGNQDLEVGNPVASQQAVKKGTGQVGIDVLVHDNQEVNQGKQQRLPQVDDDSFLFRAQGRVDTEGGTFDRIVFAPFADGVTMNPVFLGQKRIRQVGGLDLPADLGSSAGFPVKADDHHDVLWDQGLSREALASSIRLESTSLAQNKG